MMLLFALAFLFQAPHQHHPPQDATEYARVLNDPGREAWQKPHEVVMSLNLKPSDTVADIGAGSGYFAQRFARHVSKVYAVDIDRKLLEMAAKDAPPNLETVLASPDDPKLPPASVDLIFFCDVLHHIENRPAYYRKLNAALKPGGAHCEYRLLQEGATGRSAGDDEAQRGTGGKRIQVRGLPPGPKTRFAAVPVFSRVRTLVAKENFPCPPPN